MNGFANIALLMLFVSCVASSDQAVIESVQATQDVPLHLDPTSVSGVPHARVHGER